MAFFVAFYSYKGGVGRTLALANTAYALAARGKRVVLLDMDLEAPGLQDYPEFALPGKGVKKGVVDFASAYAEAGKCPPIKSYVHRCQESPGAGALWMMPAGSGVGSAYQDQLGKLLWPCLHPRKGTAPFVAELRTALDEEIRPHYVLIDSRTGLSDVGGLSTHRLAEMVVLVFNLTRSCVEGSVRTYRSFTSEDSKVRVVQLVASPVPPFAPDQGSLIERRLSQAGELMPLGTAYGRSILCVGYNPAMVLSEELAVKRPDVFPAAARYEELREAIQRANPDEVFPVLEQAQELRHEGRVEEALEILRKFAANHYDDSEAHLALGNSLLETGRAREAIESFKFALALEPQRATLYRRLGEALLADGQIDDALEALNRAAERGDESGELFLALSRAHAARGDIRQETQARRRAVLALLGLDEAPALSSPLGELAKTFVDSTERRSFFPRAEAKSLQDAVLKSLSLSPGEKGEILRQIAEGLLPLGEIALLTQVLREEAQRWIEVLGAGAADLQDVVFREGVNPRDVEAIARLGSSLGPVVRKFLAATTDEPFEDTTVASGVRRRDPLWGIHKRDSIQAFSGIGAETGSYEFPPMSIEELAAMARRDKMSAETEANARFILRSGRKGLRSGDPRDLAQSGWGVIFSADDPRADAALSALRELLDLRRAQVGADRAYRYQEYFGEFGFHPGDTKRQFLNRHGVGPGAADPDRMPYYLLIVGDPETIPYEFQQELGIQYGVGRLYFDALEDYAHYARSVVQVETQRKKHAFLSTFFAPQHPADSATELSAKWLAEPLAHYVLQRYHHWKVRVASGEEATKERLLNTLMGEEPTHLLFTAGHGVVFPCGHPLQKPHQGALLCSNWPGPDIGTMALPEHYFSADDLNGIQLAQGLVSIHYSSFSAGWPRKDPWREYAVVSPQARLARLPQSFLASGALAVVGFTDKIMIGGMTAHEPNVPLETMEDALGRLLNGYPVGAAMSVLGQRNAETAVDLAAELQEIWRGKAAEDELLAILWAAHSTFRSYAILGDPAVRLGTPL